MNRPAFDPAAMDLDGLRLIEASAGTGKTFSLAGLYLRLLVERRLSVRDILVMTFTRAATQELRERIRRRLTAAARVARDPGSADPDSAEDQLAVSVIAASTESPGDVVRRLADAANRMDEATITTIHGFSQRAIAENAFDSGLPFDRGAQVDDKSVYDEAVADYWRARTLGDGADPGFIDWWPTPADLGADLAGFRTRPHARLAGPDHAEIAALERRVAAAWQSDGDDFVAGWRQCWDQDALLKSGRLYKTIAALGGIDAALARLREGLEAQPDRPRPPGWVALLDDVGQFKKKERARGEALLEQPLTRELRRLQPLARLAALRAALAGVREMTAARKRERRQFSFADMISALHRAITDDDSGPRLSAALHGTWPWALVDEFQDTDPTQYEILRRIYTDRERGGLILIGDPKQAIFGFRGGDVFAYLDAAADAGDRVYGLTDNFRSTPDMLTAIEALYRMPGDHPFLIQGIDYRTVNAGRDDERGLVIDGAVEPACTVWHMRPEDGGKGEAQARCRDATVASIGRLLRSGAALRNGDADLPVRPRDIAVLVNTNREAADMQRALSAVGVPAVCLHQESVFERAEAMDVLRVLEAAANPTDEDRIRGALTGDLLGFRLGDLIALGDDEARRQTVVDRFQRLHGDWRGGGVLAALEPLIQGAAARLLEYVDGERRVSNYLQIADLLATAETETFGMNGLLRWLSRAIREAGDKAAAGEAEQLRLESDEAAVRIVTVHKAKGLEYPVVFIPFAPWLGSLGTPDKPPLAYHDERRRAFIDFVGTPENRERAVTEARAEGLRLLYVALTRAEIACVFPWGAANGTPDGALASLLHRDDIAPSAWGGQTNRKPLTDDLVAERLAALAAAAPEAIAVRPLPPDPAPARRLPAAADEPGAARTDLPGRREPWSVFSFTRLVRAAGPERDLPGADDELSGSTAAREDDNAGEPLPELPGGTAFGTAVHDLLESADPATWSGAGQAAGPAPDHALPEATRTEVEASLRRHGIALPAGPAARLLVDRTAELVRAGLHTPLPGIGPLAERPAAARVAELEFLLRLRGSRAGALFDRLDRAGHAAALPRERAGERLRGLMHGFIDLTVEHDGRYYVVDYKTNRLGPGTGSYRPEALATAIRAHHYDLQYLIYLTALHRHLRTRLSDYSPERHLGGVFYLFLRGMAPDAANRGVFFDRPNPGLIEDLDGLFDAGGERP